MRFGIVNRQILSITIYEFDLLFFLNFCLLHLKVNISSIASFKSEYVFASLSFVFSFGFFMTILGFVCDFGGEGTWGGRGVVLSSLGERGK